MASEAEELAQRLLSLLGSRVPHHSRGAFGQTVGQESWRITATGDQLAVLDEAAALIRRQQQEYAMLDEVCAGQAERIAQLERVPPRTAALQVLEAACRDEHGGRHHEPECAICCALKTINAVDSALPTNQKST